RLAFGVGAREHAALEADADVRITRDLDQREAVLHLARGEYLSVDQHDAPLGAEAHGLLLVGEARVGGHQAAVALVVEPALAVVFAGAVAGEGSPAGARLDSQPLVHARVAVALAAAMSHGRRSRGAAVERHD